MSGGGEYEPKDSRNVSADTNKSWRRKENPRSGRGEYAPYDQRNVEGTASTPDGRWTNREEKPPRGVPQERPMDARDAVRGEKLERERQAD